MDLNEPVLVSGADRVVVESMAAGLSAVGATAAPVGPAGTKDGVVLVIDDPTRTVQEIVADHPDAVCLLILTTARPGDDTTDIRLAAYLDAGAAALLHADQSLESLAALIEYARAGRSTMTEHARRALSDALRKHRVERAQLADQFDRLSSVEAHVLGDLMAGCRVEDIAAQRMVAVSTVRTQVRSILHKLGVNSQLAAVAIAHRAGFVPGRGQQRGAENVNVPAGTATYTPSTAIRDVAGNAFTSGTTVSTTNQRL